MSPQVHAWASRVVAWGVVWKETHSNVDVEVVCWQVVLPVRVEGLTGSTVGAISAILELMLLV